MPFGVTNLKASNQVVPDGFGVAYITGFDGENGLLAKFPTLTSDTPSDRLQYTITSRKEMPNARFCEEILRAARDLYDLYTDSDKSRL